MNTNEFIMQPQRGKPADGFVPDIVEAIGYGTQTAIDTITNKPGLVPIATKIIIGVQGQEREVDNPQCYAKILKFDGEGDYVYYIRMNSHGDVSDPWGLYQDSQSNSRMASHKGVAEYEFRRVHERAFIIYLRYLTTRNNSLLRICERDIKDA